MMERPPDPPIEPQDFQARKWSYFPELLVHLTLVVACVLGVIFGLPWPDLPGILGLVIPRLVGVLGTAVFGYASWNVVRLLRDPRPALQITGEGVLNRTYWATTTLVPWEEILEIRNTRVTGALEIVLRDPRAFRDRQTLGPRMFMRLGSLLGRPPFLIFLPQLKASRREVFDELQAAHSAKELTALREHRLLGESDESA